MSEWDIALRVGAALATVASGVLGGIYLRRLGVDAAQTRLNVTQATTIETLQTEVGTLRRMMEAHATQQERCEERLERALEKLDRWDTFFGRTQGEKPSG